MRFLIFVLATVWAQAARSGSPVEYFAANSAFVRRQRVSVRLQLGYAQFKQQWFDLAAAWLDSFYATYQQRIDGVRAGLNWKRDAEFVRRVHVGASHNEKSWRSRLGDSLTYLLGRSDAR